ncbi:D-alanine--D-alanine ligase [Hahella sp. SMD15-11]|uniref:D-alanine--D-alanine ligase n=1 Tax=Thermohahella caldifontis TaxID=3142973 RepID=A0AB39UVU6_9GAMM
MTDFGRVLVLFGGTSAERDVSLKSGQAVLDALKAAGVDAEGYDPAGGLERLLKGDYQRAFIVLHGRGGEDGAIQGVLEWLGKPYTGSGILASALCMDKARTKQVWVAAGLPTAESRVISRGQHDWAGLLDGLGGDVAVKPVCEGSSIGIQRAQDPETLEAACADAWRYDDRVLLERWIVGKEYTVAILGDRALPVIRMETDHAFYDYEAKYLADDTRYFIPCGLSKAEERTMQKLALDAAKACGCKGWGRVDIMRDNAGNNWLLEVNTVPGMTDHSLVPMAAAHAGMDFQALCLAILETSRLKEES